MNGAPAYTDNGTQIFAGASLISYPDNAGIALDPQGDVLLGSDYPDGAVYEVPASSGTSPTTTSTASTSSSSTSTSTTSPTSTSTTTTTVPPGPFPGWTVVTPPDGLSAGNGPPVTPVSCAPGTTFCVAVLGSPSVLTVYGQTGQGVAVTSNLTNWTSYDSLPSQFVQVLSISCPTSTRCVAVGTGMTDAPVIAVSTNGGVSWTDAKHVGVRRRPRLAPGRQLPVGSCLLHGRGHDGAPDPMAAVSTDGGQDWTLLDNNLPSPLSYDLDAISCSSVSTCVAGGELSEVGPATAISTISGGTSWSQSGSSVFEPVGGNRISVMPERDDRLLRRRRLLERRWSRRANQH